MSETMTVFACSTDWDHHLSGDPKGCPVFASLERLLDARVCLRAKAEASPCDVVKIQCTVERFKLEDVPR